MRPEWTALRVGNDAGRRQLDDSCGRSETEALVAVAGDLEKKNETFLLRRSRFKEEPAIRWTHLRQDSRCGGTFR